jgi:hypothetical protein
MLVRLLLWVIEYHVSGCPDKFQIFEEGQILGNPPEIIRVWLYCQQKAVMFHPALQKLISDA